MPEVARFPAGPQIRQWARMHGFSDWIVARWAHLLEHPGPFLRGLQERPSRYIRRHGWRRPPADIRARLEARGFEFGDTPLDDEMLRVRHAPMSAGATVEHLKGLTTPQDLASAAPVLALDPRPGEFVVDLAAAPGAKTLHIVGRMRDEGTVVAVEPDNARMQALRFNLERCGVRSARLIRAPAQNVPGEGWADRVMLGAPCTGEGTIPRDRRRRRGKPEEIALLARLQEEIVDAADRILRPGGTMVYSTCTFGPEENEAQVQRLIDRGYRLQPLPFEACGAPLVPGVTEWPGLELDPDMGLTKRFLPGVHPTLGLYVALLRKGDE